MCRSHKVLFKYASKRRIQCLRWNVSSLTAGDLYFMAMPNPLKCQEAIGYARPEHKTRELEVSTRSVCDWSYSYIFNKLRILFSCCCETCFRTLSQENVGADRLKKGQHCYPYKKTILKNNNKKNFAITAVQWRIRVGIGRCAATATSWLHEISS